MVSLLKSINVVISERTKGTISAHEVDARGPLPVWVVACWPDPVYASVAACVGSRWASPVFFCSFDHWSDQKHQLLLLEIPTTHPTIDSDEEDVKTSISMPKVSAEEHSSGGRVGAARPWRCRQRYIAAAAGSVLEVDEAPGEQSMCCHRWRRAPLAQAVLMPDDPLLKTELATVLSSRRTTASVLRRMPMIFCRYRSHRRAVCLQFFSIEGEDGRQLAAGLSIEARLRSEASSGVTPVRADAACDLRWFGPLPVCQGCLCVSRALALPFPSRVSPIETHGHDHHAHRPSPPPPPVCHALHGRPPSARPSPASLEGRCQDARGAWQMSQRRRRRRSVFGFH